MRPLSDATDGVACGVLLSGITRREFLTGEWGVGLFESNGLYMMVFYPFPVETHRIRAENGVLRGRVSHTHVSIFRSDLSRAAAWLL